MFYHFVILKPFCPDFLKIRPSHSKEDLRKRLFPVKKLLKLTLNPRLMNKLINAHCSVETKNLLKKFLFLFDLTTSESAFIEIY